MPEGAQLLAVADRTVGVFYRDNSMAEFYDALTALRQASDCARAPPPPSPPRVALPPFTPSCGRAGQRCTTTETTNGAQNVPFFLSNIRRLVQVRVLS